MNAIILNESELKQTLREMSVEISQTVVSKMLIDSPPARAVMTARQLAEYLQVTERSISVWTRRKINPLPVGYVGSDPRFFADEVRDWMKREAARKLHKTDENITEILQ